jgi:FAD/FMN-containing dehydrogenase
MGGAAVLSPAVVVDLGRLDAVHVDAEACMVRAGAGATLARVDQALAAHGLMLGHDPWTVAVATVGGALSTNGLGYLGARAGSFGDQVSGIEAVLADGRVVRTPVSPARSTGLDLARLLVGTEGTLGFITEATLAALPRPEERLIRGYELPSFAAGVGLAATLRRRGVRFACLELSAEDLPPAPASMLLVFDGLAGEAALHAERAAALGAEVGGVPRSEADAEAQWNARHVIAERWAAHRGRPPGAGGGEFDYAHVGVPLHALDAVRGVAHACVRRHRLRLVEEGLWHRPELYSIVVAGPPGSADAVRATIDAVCVAAQDAGGTMEYCHGVGWKLAHLVGREHGAAGLDVMRRVKAALDPAGIMNPGKGGL